MSKSKYVMPEDFAVAHDVRCFMDSFDPSKTRQEFAEECDINVLMERYEKGGAITHVNKAMPIYMDVTALPDLRGALDIMREASLAFASLPARARREFDNDPQLFVDFAQNPENIERMREWGLAPPPPGEPPAVRVEVVNPIPAPGEPPK